MNDFEAIEFHDARLLHLTMFLRQREVRLSFENVSVFYRTPVAETFEVWSFTADVALNLPAKLVLEGPPPEDGWIIDDRLEGVAADSLDWRGCLVNPVNVLSLSFRFNNGAKLTFTDSLVKLTLLEKKRFLETWTGPL